jgi:DNA polymerase I-like protein with 3'-5' exonuclease and polymerase domains
MDCGYCKNVGACPRCWGGGQIQALKKEIEDLRAEVRDQESKRIYLSLHQPLRIAIQMLERDGVPVRQEIANELRRKLDEISAWKP